MNERQDAVSELDDAELAQVFGGAPADPAAALVGSLVKLGDGLAQAGADISKSLARWFF